MKKTLNERVEEALASIKPALQTHGGDVELIEIKDGIVKIRLKGACAGCPMAGLTLKHGVEREIKSKVPEILRVDAVLV